MTEFHDDLADPDGDPPEAICGAKEVGALAHLYRAEVYRSTVWRQRLDQTTNWAVISTGIGLSVAFANAQASPFPIVLVGALCIVFLTLESRRYRFFYVWRFRARVLEIAFYVPMLRGEGARIPLDRGTALSDDYEKPQYRISNIRAIGRRLRRNYGWLFAILGAAYFAKIAIHPTDVETWSQFVRRAHIGPIPGLVAISFGLLFHATWIGIAVKTWLDERHDKSKMADFLNSRKDVNAREDAQAEMDILGH
ncbi:DUF2270 domain-containing protein [Hyphomonas sp.]|jgi:uncharacterized membrane protein|uniref:DUF2270 domain-containing protein n=1 Tax=Hyphomonas sp. TaxID=87 RepID=UPI0030FC8193